VQVHCNEGVAIRIGPEPCVGIREDDGEASAGERIGQPSSRVNLIVPSADVFESTDVRKPEDVHFLGFRFRCAKEGDGDTIAVFPSRKTERRLMVTMREMTPPNWGRSISSCMENISRYLTGWISYFRLCTPEAVKGLGVIDAHVRRRVRAIIVRQKKRQRFL
jgi:hypothetical protein